MSWGTAFPTNLHARRGKLRSVCTSTQTDQSRCCPIEDIFVPLATHRVSCEYFILRMKKRYLVCYPKMRPDCANEKAYLKLYRAHMSKGLMSHVAAQII